MRRDAAVSADSRGGWEVDRPLAPRASPSPTGSRSGAENSTEPSTAKVLDRPPALRASAFCSRFTEETGLAPVCSVGRSLRVLCRCKGGARHASPGREG